MKRIFFAAAIVLLYLSNANAGCYSEGVRVGDIQKFSQKGFVNKSWEGELVMEGVKIRSTSDGGVRGGNVWRFSVLDASVAKVIDSAVMSGKRVGVKYCQRNPFAISFETSTKYIVTQATEQK